MKRFLSVFFIMILLMSGCTVNGDETATPDISNETDTENETETTPPPREVTVTDSAGREVTTSADNGDIVSTGFEATSLLISLGVEKRLTGVEATAADTELFKLAFPEISNVEKVTNENGVDIDAVIAQNPGLVVLANDQRDLVSSLEGAGIVCAVVALDTIENIESSIELLGKLVNSETRASKLYNYYSSALTRLKVLTMSDGTVQTVSVYNNDPFILSMLENVHCTVEEGSENVIARFGEGEGMITVPDAIERWDEPSVSLVLGIYWYSHKLYPDLFTDNELSQRAINFYSEFYDITVTDEQVGIPIEDAA